jgi:alanyl-tRNA synthetase
MLKTEREGILDKIENIIAEQKDLEKEIQVLKSKLIAKQTGNIFEDVREIYGIKVLITKVEGENPKSLREYGDKMRDRLGSGILVIGAEHSGKAHLLSMVTNDISAKFSAKKIIEAIAPIVGGQGGGKDEMAQAGGKNPAMIEKALQKARQVIEAMGQSG